MTNIELYLRIAFAFALMLAPGFFLARALGIRSAAATLGWSLTLLFGALIVTFVLATSLTTAIALFAIAGLASLAAMLVRRHGVASKARGAPGRWIAGG